MANAVFISYARAARTTYAARLAKRFGNTAFFDEADIEFGIRFPERVLDGILQAQVVVIFAGRAYLASHYCRLELQLALALADRGASHVVLALEDGWEAMLPGLPTSMSTVNWPHAHETDQLVRRVRTHLEEPSNRDAVSSDMLRRLSAAFLDQARIPPPLKIKTVCSLPDGLARQSIGNRFVGREAELHRIHRLLSPGGGAVAQLTARIAAGAGFGKSRLAAEYLHRFGPRDYPGGVFWVNAEVPDFEVELWRVLKDIKVDTPNLAEMRRTDRDIRRELEAALRQLNQPALYIVDSVPESAPCEGPPAVEAFCPAPGAVALLVTSRQATFAPGTATIELEALTPTAAVLLLTENVDVGTLPWEQWEEVAAWVGRLPVVLDLLNRALALRLIAPQDLLERVRSGTANTEVAPQLEQLYAELKNRVEQGSVRGFAATLMVSLEKLSGEALATLAVLAQLAPAPIPEELMDALPPECSTEGIKSDLRDRHLVTAGDQGSFGVMHQLPVSCLRAIATGYTPKLALVASGALRSLMTKDSCRNPDRWPVMNQCRIHAEELLKRGPDIGTDDVDLGMNLSELALCVAMLAGAQGRLTDALPFQKHAADERKRILGESHYDTLTAVGAVANTTAMLGDYEEAYRIEKALLERRIQTQGEDHPHTLVAMINIADSLRALNRLDEAEDVLRSAVTKLRTVCGPTHPDTLRAMHNLAIVNHAKGHYKQAAADLGDVLSDWKDSRGEEHPESLLIQGNLGDTLRRQSRHAEAQQILERVFAAQQRILGDDHPDTLRTSNNLALALEGSGDLEGARTHLERVLEVTTANFGPKHPDRLQALTNLGEVLRIQGKYERSISLLEESVSTYASAGTEDTSAALLANRCLSLALFTSGRDPKRGLELQENVLERSTPKLGESHPETLVTMENVAYMRAAQRDYSGALKLRQRIAVLIAEQRGEDDPMTWKARFNLAKSLDDSGDLSESERLLFQCQDAQIRILGRSHPDTVETSKLLIRHRSSVLVRLVFASLAAAVVVYFYKGVLAAGAAAVLTFVVLLVRPWRRLRSSRDHS